MPTPHARSQILIGDDGLDRLRHKIVLIAGLGGVGGYSRPWHTAPPKPSPAPALAR